MTVGVAIVGCGLIGHKRAAALPPSTRVLALFDSDRRAAEELARSLDGSVEVSRSAVDAMSAAGVDLVVVATPHNTLVPLALEAVRRDRAVLVEKPGGSSLEHLRQLQREAGERDRPVYVGFNHRFHPAMVKARQLLVDGRHGRLMHIRARYGHGGRSGYEREWRTDRRISGGGELVDQGIHLIDLTRFFAGEVSLAFADLRTSFWPIAVEDNAFFALRTDAGALAWLHASWTEWKNLFSFEIALERAKLEITGLGGSYGPESLSLYEMTPAMEPPRRITWEWPTRDDSWRLEVEHIIAGIEKNAVTSADAVAPASLDDAIAAFRIVDDAYRYSPTAPST